MLTGANYDISFSEFLERLNWKNFNTRFEFNKTALVYSIPENGNALLKDELSNFYKERNNSSISNWLSWLLTPAILLIIYFLSSLLCS